MLETNFSEEPFQASFDLFDPQLDTASEGLPVQAFHLTPVGPAESGAMANKAEPRKALSLPPELVTRLAQPDAFACFGFAKDNPLKNCFRRYIITYQPSLWSEYVILRQWGRLGSERMLSRTEHFGEATPAQKRICRLIRRRLGRGYRLSFAA